MGRPASRRLAPASDEPLLPREERRAQGIYYTPPQIVRQLVRLTIQGLRGTLRVLDPACGAGAMLVEAVHQLTKRGQSASIFGMDCDPQAVVKAQVALPTTQIWVGDTLFDDRLDRLAPFDVIVGNPPYVNIRQLAKSLSAEDVQRLRARFATARGNFDLYVPFIERALELLAPGGRCGLVIPNKWATLDYAQSLRKLLLETTTIQHVVDLSAVRVFAEASVYPHLLVFTKEPPTKSHFVHYQAGRQQTTTPQRLLSPSAICFTSSLDVESRALMKPLGELAVLSCGTPGYSAQRMAAALREASESGGRSAQADCRATEFITSGNIDRYSIRLGNVRFLGRTYQQPVLPLDSPEMTDRQRRLFASQKIVIAGLSQRIEAAWDDRGLALGVQVFAASDFQVDPQYLLALLNSKLLSYLFRTRFAAKCLAGGYLAINKGQLARLPIVVRSLRERKPPPQVLDDAAIDQWVYRLYRLSKAEIADVETHFAALGRRAA